MKSNLICWFLSGALAGSLGLNVSQASRAAAAAAAPAAQCAILDSLDLTPQQRRALEACCTPCCADQDALEREADAKAAALEAELASDAFDAQRVRQVAGELDELRSRRLLAALDAMLRVREVLRPEQIASLVTRCASRASASCPECGTK
jgi:Spy/CpxP family protein refolding chaperone